jgi:hypothetical protein
MTGCGKKILYPFHNVGKVERSGLTLTWLNHTGCKATKRQQKQARLMARSSSSSPYHSKVFPQGFDDWTDSCISVFSVNRWSNIAKVSVFGGPNLCNKETPSPVLGIGFSVGF